MSKAMLFYDPRPQFFDNDGNVLTGGKLFFYVASTTTKKNTYTDVTKATPNPNPIILDSAGRPDNAGTPVNVFLDGTYKVVLAPADDTDPPTNSIWTVNNVNTLGQLVRSVNITTNYTVTEDDRDKLLLVDATSGAVTINLPAIATAGDGFNVKFKKIDNSVNTVTIDANSTEVIDDATTYVLASQFNYVSIYVGDTKWWTTNNSFINAITLVDGNGNTVITTGTATTPVNYITATNAATGADVQIAATGTDTNIGVLIKGKGTGKIRLGQATSLGVQLEADQPILDSSGNELLKVTKVASAVNELGVSNAATATNPIIIATGGDTNVGIDLQAKGTGTFNFKSTTDQEARIRLFEDVDNGTNYIEQRAPANVAANRVIQFPDSDIGAFLVGYAAGTTTFATNTTTIPQDNTIPQNTEGSQVLSVSYTPKHAANTLIIDVILNGVGCSTGTVNTIAALFQDSIANALASSYLTSVQNYAGIITLRHVMTTGTTSAVAFKVRMGLGSAGTWLLGGVTFNLGGINYSSIIVREYSI